MMLFSKTLCFDFMDEALQVPVRSVVGQPGDSFRICGELIDQVCGDPACPERSTTPAPTCLSST